MTEASYRLVPWTLTALAISAFPHIFRLPVQITLVVSCILVARVVLHLQVRKMPPQWMKIFLALITFLIVLVTFHTINGVDAGSALLLCMVVIKTLEMNTLRDHAALLVASFFIIVSFILYDTSIWSGLYILPSTAFSLFVLLRVSAPSVEWIKLIPSAKQFVWYGIPLALILFVLFPRIPGPLWGIPNTSGSAKTGLSNSMTPGSITDLVKSNELAFRAKFLTNEPLRKNLYWRGPVLHKFDGKTWNMQLPYVARTDSNNEKYASEKNTSYEIILEPHNERWVYVLDYPRELPKNSTMLQDFQVGRTLPVTQLTRYMASSQAGESSPGFSNPYILERALQLPPSGANQTRQLAQQWRNDYVTDERVAQAALRLFNKEFFSYTLSPQALDMTDSVDDFLFRTREGFCGHYASAFVVLMRAAGIPARVVTGYLGGEKNVLNDYYRIRQSDAHAWAEIFLKESGWTRVDPTGAIAPERIEQSLEETFPGANLGGFFSGSSFYLRLENSWYALNTAWFEWVLDYNDEKQMNLLLNLGFDNPDWSSLIWLLVAGVLALTLFMSLHIWRQSNKRIEDPLQRIYLKFIEHLKKLGYESVNGEGPKDLCQRASESLPEYKPLITEFTQTYIEARYFSTNIHSEKLTALKSILKQF